MRLVMMGTGTFAEPTFEALLSAFGGDVVGLVTQPERDAGSKRGSTRQTGKGMGTIATAAGVAVAQPESINTPEGLEQLRAMRPDLLVVAAYGQILSKDVLSTPTRGTINVHASLLPKYRGAAPVAYAILGGEKQTGVTIIKVTPGLDSGDMILQESLDIAPDDTTGTLEAKLAALGSRMAVEAVRKYQTGGPVDGVKQDPMLVTKAPKIKKEFGLIDWTKPAEYISRCHIPAMQPWPTAYTYFHRPDKKPMRVIIIEADEFPVRCNEGFEPGQVFKDPGGRFATSLFVAAGVTDGGETRSVLEISELQPAGKKKMTAVEFLRGYPIVEGMRFGPEVLA
ncbi:MAG: methionyl-tRNA formyltransferase [Planctomycetes bacterium]|nr:methionyl-tRNA formyltransferase [Planctomycetota bacterium]